MEEDNVEESSEWKTESEEEEHVTQSEHMGEWKKKKQIKIENSTRKKMKKIRRREKNERQRT